MEFKPERWIKDGKFVSENQFKYAVFNAGPRLCLGKKFAYLQMKMVAASILLRYSIKVVEGHDAVPKMTTTLYMKNGLLVTLTPRLVQKRLTGVDSDGWTKSTVVAVAEIKKPSTCPFVR
uniref:Cytochrome P450 n=1 Tax=Salix viminalis TaxID=40686 RepID=A0A6N2L6U4_SALVM